MSTAEYQRQYREKNREKLRAYHQEYRAKHRDEINRNQKKWRDTHQDDVRRKLRTERGIVHAPGEIRHGECPICLKTKKLACDHDHVTGRIRGWICSTCNVFLGPTNTGRGARAAAYEAAHDSQA